MASLENLRLEAEKRVERNRTGAFSDDMQELVHDLQLHKVELEMQNEELTRSNGEVETLSTKYQNLFQYAPTALFLLDKTGIIKDSNQAGLKLLGFEKSRVTRKPIQSFIDAEYTDAFYYFLQLSLSNSQKQSMELRLKRKKGEFVYLIIESIKLTHGESCYDEIIIAANDISERKEAAEALLEAHKRLEAKVKERTKELEEVIGALRAVSQERQKQTEELLKVNTALVESEKRLKELNESKNKFFAILSHDLKNSIYGLQGYSKLLTSKIGVLGKEEIAQYAQTIHTYSVRLEKLLNDVLSWSTLQMGHFAYLPSKVQLKDIITETVEIYSINAAEKSISIRADDKVDYSLLADENMLKSIFRNLISNAIKFTRVGGQINIKVEDSVDFLLVKISDNGNGISPKVKSKIFKIDEQILSVGTSQEKGHGLGLVLCKEFVEKHGGSIWFESEEGKGTTFLFTLKKRENLV